MRWLRNIALLLVGILALLLIAGASYQAIANRADARRFPEPGRLIDVGGYRLKLNCTGAGSPTVVLESGLGDVSIEWQPVQSSVAKFSRVCSYDRAGYGGSDAGPALRTSQQIAGELNALLKNAGEKPPFILVGHSFGGYNVRVFNGRFPDEVAGLLLVDSVQEDQYKLLPPVWNRVGSDLRAHYRSQARWAPLLIDFGIARLMLRSRGQDQNSYLILQTKYLKARSNELDHIEVSAEQARAAGALGDKPLIVLTAGKKPAAVPLGLSEQDMDEFQRVWAGDLQLRLARLSSRGKRELVEDSGHDIPSERPDAVVHAVREIEAAISSSR
ncbi:MAG TPA: alpha/beta hydrolase [Candidatus Sulfotelmatobacter sp.]|nr:alpha/beta hydrolase [Candidatus Sulfotelmatobacter sp.]